jgi:pimeloyl-ACP methyl ester carboxylesterase
MSATSPHSGRAPHRAPWSAAVCSLLVCVAAAVPAAAAERRSYADGAESQIHYRSAGSGPPVLLLHQTPWFSVQFSRVLPLLAQAGFSALAPDTPGWGFSPAPAGERPLEWYADQMVAVLDAAGARRVALVGDHTGAAIAMVLATRHPERVRCIVLYGPPLYSDEERRARLERPPPPAATPRDDGSHLLDLYRLQMKIAHGSAEGARWATTSVLMAEDRNDNSLRAIFRHAPLDATLRDLRIPGMLLTARDDWLYPAAVRAKALRPDFRYVEFEHGGSLLAFEQPQTWATAVVAFLRSDCGN